MLNLFSQHSLCGPGQGRVYLISRIAVSFWTSVEWLKDKKNTSKNAQNSVSLQFWTGETPYPPYWTSRENLLR